VANRADGAAALGGRSDGGRRLWVLLRQDAGRGLPELASGSVPYCIFLPPYGSVQHPRAASLSPAVSAEPDPRAGCGSRGPGARGSPQRSVPGALSRCCLGLRRPDPRWRCQPGPAMICPGPRRGTTGTAPRGRWWHHTRLGETFVPLPSVSLFSVLYCNPFALGLAAHLSRSIAFGLRGTLAPSPLPARLVASPRPTGRPKASSSTFTSHARTSTLQTRRP
jgi:hypothetical protein